MKRINMMGVVLLVLLAANMWSIKVEAASKYVRIADYDKNKTVNGVTFEFSETNIHCTQIAIVRKGVRTVIDSYTSGVLFTNGKYVYYMRSYDCCGPGKHTFYKYSIKTGKKVKVFAGKGYWFIGCNDKYIYACGMYDAYEETSKAYVIDINKKKKKYIGKQISFVRFAKNRVITGHEAGQAYNAPIYSMKFDGSGKLKIAEGCLEKAKGNTVYYYKVDNRGMFKVYSCTTKGKKHKALTGWLTYDKIPKKYKEIR